MPSAHNLSVQPPEAVSNSHLCPHDRPQGGRLRSRCWPSTPRESFEDNKRHYRQRAAEEDLPVISRLLEADAKSLDRLQIQMATAREFFVLVRLREETGMELHTHLSRIQKSLEDQASRQASPAARISSACWACILSRMPPRKNMRITTGNAGSF